MSKQNIRVFIGCIISFGFFILLGVMVFVPLPRSNGDVIKILVGFLGGSFTMLISFYFGDSEGK